MCIVFVAPDRFGHTPRVGQEPQLARDAADFLDRTDARAQCDARLSFERSLHRDARTDQLEYGYGVQSIVENASARARHE